MWPGVGIVLLVTGCFAKPEPPMRDSCSSFGPWSVPAELPHFDNRVTDPALSPDGRTLVYSVNFGPGAGETELHVATWDGTSFVNHRPMAEVNTNLKEDGAAFSPDGMTLHFFHDGHENRVAPILDPATLSLGISTRTDEFAMVAPFASERWISRPRFTADYLVLVIATYDDVVVQSARVSTADTWPAAVPLSDLDQPNLAEKTPVVSADGLTLVYVVADSDLYIASRSNLMGPFEKIERLDVGMSATEPELSTDATILLFKSGASDRLYRMARTCMD